MLDDIFYTRMREGELLVADEDLNLVLVITSTRSNPPEFFTAATYVDFISGQRELDEYIALGKDCWQCEGDFYTYFVEA